MDTTTNEYQHWTVDKRVNISHLLTTVAMVVSLFVYVNKTDQRITTLEANLANSKNVMTILDTRLNRIEDKLDRLIEKNQ